MAEHKHELKPKEVLCDILCWPGGSSSAVERQLPKLDVAGSIPVSRSSFPPLVLRFQNRIVVRDPVLPT